MSTTSAVSTRRFGAIAAALLDVVVPVVGYYLLHALGVSTFWALTVSGLACGLLAAVNTVRRRRLDALGLLIVVELALSVVLLFTTRDPRVVLLKPAFFTAVGGLYAIGTCLLGRPLVRESGKPFAAKGDPRRMAAFDRAWDTSARFRRVLTETTLVWGLALLLDAVARTVVVLHFSVAQVNDSLLLSQAPGVVLLVLAVAFTRLRVRSIRSVLDQALVPASS